MKLEPLGIYYLEYAKQPFPRSARKLIIGYERDQMLKDFDERKIPDEYLCWLEECRTPIKLFSGTAVEIREWISNHMPLKFKEPIR